ncbi:MAG: hypothetical protein WCI74_09200 [Actinomycetes bacterium]
MNTHPAIRVGVTSIGILCLGALLAGCGGGTTVSINKSDPTAVPSISMSGPNGSLEVGGKLPSNWPSDVPTPTQIPLINAAAINAGMNATYRGTGDIVAIQNDLTARFLQNGFTQAANFNFGSASGGVVSYDKGGMKVQVVAAVEGGQAVVNETIVPSASAAP